MAGDIFSQGDANSQIARLDERINNLSRAHDKLERVSATKEALSQVATGASAETGRVDKAWREELVRVQQAVLAQMAAMQMFTPDQARKLLRILEEYEEDNSEKKDFDKQLRISVVTMIASVLLFSLLVPIIQHYVIH